MERIVRIRILRIYIYYPNTRKLDKFVGEHRTKTSPILRLKKIK